MKDNKDINNGGRLLKKNYATWAEYMVKYIEGMKERGIEIDMISIQNEPAAKQEWASCKYEACLLYTSNAYRRGSRKDAL